MTPEETERAIRALQAKDVRHEETDDTVDLWRVNGAENLLGGYGFAIFGGGKERLSQMGLQMLATEGDVGLFWVSAFVAGLTAGEDIIAAVPKPYAYILGGADKSNNDAGTLTLMAQGTAVAAGAKIELKAADGVTTNFGTQLGASLGPFVSIQALLEILCVTSDPAVGLLSDGMIFYRSDTDKPRFRANGVTENLAFESYVTTAVAAVGGGGYANSLMLMGA